MRKLLCMLLCVLLLPLPSLAEESVTLPVLNVPEEVIRPGKAYLLTFDIPEAGLCSLLLCTEDGQTVIPVVKDYAAQAGFNQLWWNGTGDGMPAKAGTYQLMLVYAGMQVSAPVTVGPMAPYLTSIVPVKDVENGVLTVDFYASVDGTLSIGVWAGNVWSLVESRQVSAGMNSVQWNASAMKEGTYALTLTLTDAAGFPSNEEHIMVSPEEFGIVFATATPTPTATPEPTPAATAEPMAAPEATAEVAEQPEASIVIDPDAALEVGPGEPTATPTAEPTAAPEPTPDIVFTPSYGTVYPLTEVDAATYWGTPMDITDEEAVWAMLSAPITVLNADMKGQKKVYAEPSEDSRTVGVLTGKSQGVRVIEVLDNGWTLIEFYSSTFHDNSIEAWNMLVQGYVPSDMLVTRDMSDKSIHIVVDKLTQRAYVFKDGALFTTLLVSTGITEKGKPYNETRSGEFLYISPTGGFWSDNMFCPSALKFNDGDLLHEVPYVQRDRNPDNSKIYSATEPYLGQRASHGCIRVQRKRTPEGVNMTWIWNNRKELGRIVVWEDWQGRQMSYPADETILYYNAKGGSYYHRSESCYSAKASVKFTPFTYAELETGDYAKLDYCPYCAPALRRSEIDEINAVHAFGGDHDPLMTQARQEYLSTIPAEEMLPCEERYLVPAADE